VIISLLILNEVNRICMKRKEFFMACLLCAKLPQKEHNCVITKVIHNMN